MHVGVVILRNGKYKIRIMKTMKKKKVYFELMRITAVCLVIFNHLDGYYLYQKTAGLKQWIYMFLTMITRVNVPLFLMISGALLMGREEDYAFVFRNRVKRFIMVMLLFEGAMFAGYKLDSIMNHYAYRFTLKRFVFGFLENTLEGMVLPLLQRIAKGMKKADFMVLISLHFLFFTLLPLVNLVLSAGDWGSIDSLGSFYIPLATEKALFYPLAGYYLENCISVETFSRKKTAWLLAAGTAGIVLSCLCTYYQGITTGKFTQKYVQLFDYMTAIAAFIFIKSIVVKGLPFLSRGKPGKMICFLGSLTFGIYLLDPFLKLFFYERYDAFAEPFLPTILVSAGWILISFAVGGFLTFLLKRIPLLRKLL